LFPCPRQAVLRPRRGQILRDYFDYLNVVPLTPEKAVTYCVNPSFDGSTGLALERVAILPVVLTADEVEWRLEGTDVGRHLTGKSHYHGALPFALWESGSSVEDNSSDMDSNHGQRV
jgi:hypothetical protein